MYNYFWHYSFRGRLACAQEGVYINVPCAVCTISISLGRLSV